MKSAVALLAGAVAWLCVGSGLRAAEPEPLTGVLGAMPVEIQLLRGWLAEARTETHLGVTFHRGRLHGRAVALAASGIGKVNAARTATLLLEHYQPHEVLFTGVAGGLNPELAAGDLVLGEKTGQHDFGKLTDSGFTAEPTGADIPLLMPTSPTLLALAEAAVPDAGLTMLPTSQGLRQPRVRRGIIVTGDMFVASAAKTAELRQRFQADAVEMEGAAVTQVCWPQRVPCLVIRSISDKADAAAPVDFEQFVSFAATNSARLTAAMLKRLASPPKP